MPLPPRHRARGRCPAEPGWAPGCLAGAMLYGGGRGHPELALLHTSLQTPLQSPAADPTADPHCRPQCRPPPQTPPQTPLQAPTTDLTADPSADPTPDPDEGPATNPTANLTADPTADPLQSLWQPPIQPPHGAQAPSSGQCGGGGGKDCQGVGSTEQPHTAGVKFVTRVFKAGCSQPPPAFEVLLMLAAKVPLHTSNPA